jgi:hypothetical protein
VRLAFANGCVANLTASRISTEAVRKLRLFQPHQYLSLDYARRDLAIFSVGENRQIGFEQAQIAKAEPLKLQLDAFLDSIATRNPAKSSGPAARRTLSAALALLDKIEEHSQVVSQTHCRMKPVGPPPLTTSCTFCTGGRSLHARTPQH